MPFVTVEGARLHYTVDGALGAPPLILSNSLSSDLTMWDRQVEQWSRRFRIIRYDQRGHGGSSAPEGEYSMAMLGKDVLALMDHLAIERADWCGISMGGMTGMWLALNAPSRLDRLVLANTSPYMPPAELWDGRIATAKAGGMEALATPTVERWFPPEFRARNPETVERTRQMVLATPVNGYAGCCAAIRDMNLRDEIAGIAHETLVIVGERDLSTPPAEGEFIQRSIAGSRLVRLDAGHVSNIERPDDFASAVDRFL